MDRHETWQTGSQVIISTEFRIINMNDDFSPESGPTRAVVIIAHGLLEHALCYYNLALGSLLCVRV